jgi:hypothetical protein
LNASRAIVAVQIATEKSQGNTTVTVPVRTQGAS